ncbi:MAG: DUF559 domain-containing protein [Anaerolineae bacterium]|nr:DUF559 domain-containing protein [Anaerolineae bacterium]
MATERRPHPEIVQRAKALRQRSTLAESKLWFWLRDRKLGGFKFRRQHPIERFIADFECESCKLIIELDGASHADQTDYDALRTDRLTELGYVVMRFSNDDVQLRLNETKEKIHHECLRRQQELILQI